MNDTRLIAGELIKRGEPVYIEDNVVYVQRLHDNAVDCDEYDEGSDGCYNYDLEFTCPLELINRKYCKEYKPKE